jgi:hypothetical protein
MIAAVIAADGRHQVYQHLKPDAAAALTLSDADRIASLHQDRWVPYDSTIDVEADVERWLSHDRTNRPEGIFLVGRSNNGKTSLLKHAADLHKPQTAMQGSGIHAPVLLLQTPPSGDANACYSTIASYLSHPVPRRASPRLLREVCVEALRSFQVQVLMFDEINHLLSGPVARQRSFLFALKYLSNELRLNLVTAGTPESARLHTISDQMQSRMKLVPLYVWTKARPKRLRQLLANMEELLPLKLPSNLQSVEIAREIASSGLVTFGEISQRLNACAERAITTGVERITVEIIRDLKTHPAQSLSRMMQLL